MAEADASKTWGPGDFQVGDYALISGVWYEIQRANKNTVSVLPFDAQTPTLRGVHVISKATRSPSSATDSRDYAMVGGRMTAAEFAAHFAIDVSHVTLATVGDLASLYRLPEATVKAWRARELIGADVNVSRTDIYVLERIAPRIFKLGHEIDVHMLREHVDRARVPAGSVLLGQLDVASLVHVSINIIRNWSSSSNGGRLPKPAAVLGPAGVSRPLPLFTAAQFRTWPDYDVQRVEELAEKQMVRAPWLLAEAGAAN